MTFWSQSGLSALAGTESGGNPCAVFGNPNAPCGTPAVPGTGSGLYGFVNSTWNDYGGYASANLAPASVQTAKAAATDISNWTCPGCNPSAAGLAADPNNVAATSITAGANGAASSYAPLAPDGSTIVARLSNYGTGGIPTPTPTTNADNPYGIIPGSAVSYLPSSVGNAIGAIGSAIGNTANVIAPGLTPTAAAANASPGFQATLTSWFTTIAIVVLALILIAMAVAPGGIKRAMAMAV